MLSYYEKQKRSMEAWIRNESRTPMYSNEIRANGDESPRHFSSVSSPPYQNPVVDGDPPRQSGTQDSIRLLPNKPNGSVDSPGTNDRDAAYHEPNGRDVEEILPVPPIGKFPFWNDPILDETNKSNGSPPLSNSPISLKPNGRARIVSTECASDSPRFKLLHRTGQNAAESPRFQIRRPGLPPRRPHPPRLAASGRRRRGRRGRRLGRRRHRQGQGDDHDQGP